MTNNPLATDGGDPYNTSSDAGESPARYGGLDDWTIDDISINKEQLYPNSWTVPAAAQDGEPFPPQDLDPLQNHIGDFYRGLKRFQRKTSPTWGARTIGLVANSQPVRIIAANPRRKTVNIYPDSTNTSPVFLSPSPNGVAGVGSDAISLQVNNTQGMTQDL